MSAILTAFATSLVMFRFGIKFAERRRSRTDARLRSRERREAAKREIDEARAERRRRGVCDGKGECTSVLSHKNHDGWIYCDDCGRPRRESF